MSFLHFFAVFLALARQGDTEINWRFGGSYLAQKVGGLWYEAGSGGGENPDRPLTWLEGAAGFADYDLAFLFHSYVGGYDEGTGAWTTAYADPLVPGFTDGFVGATALPESPLAVFLASGATVTGETTVPIPSALWLLGSGLLGLFGGRLRV